MKLLFILTLAAVCATAVPAAADVITVMPDPQPTDLPVGQVGVGETTLTHGWSIVTNGLGWGKVCSYGPSTYQSRTGAFFAHYLDWYNDAWHPDTDFGRGAFYGTCDFFKGTAPIMSGDWQPSNVWLGTGTWKGASVAGKTLGSIDVMDYYSFCSKTPTRFEAKKNELEWWGKASYMRGPQQPIQLQLVIQSPDLTEMRQLWYRPWGYNFTGDDGLTEPGSQKGRWQWFTCLVARPGGEGKWYMPCTGSTPNNLEYGWDTWTQMLDFQLPDGPLPAFRNWVLADPASINKSPGWDSHSVPTGTVNSTGTGKPINFFMGARVSLVRQIRDTEGNPIPNTGLFLQGVDALWPNACNGMRAQMDYFTLGFSGQGTETYNFEPAADDPPAHILSCSHKSLDVLRSPTMFTCNQWTGNLFRVVGKVAHQASSATQYFLLEDGSKLTYRNSGYDPSWTVQYLPGPIRVYLPDDGFRGAPLWITEGQLVEVVGYVEPLRYAFPNPPELGRDANSPLCVWTNINNVRVLAPPSP